MSLYELGRKPVRKDERHHVNVAALFFCFTRKPRAHTRQCWEAQVHMLRDKCNYERGLENQVAMPANCLQKQCKTKSIQTTMAPESRSAIRTKPQQEGPVNNRKLDTQPNKGIIVG